MPGSEAEADSKGRVHFARHLLKVIAKKIEPDPATGLRVLRDPDSDVHSQWVNGSENGA